MGNGFEVVQASHVDHGLNGEALNWLQRVALADLQMLPAGQVLVKSYELPKDAAAVGLPCALRCQLHGPMVGEAAVSSDEASELVRAGRSYPSRICARAPSTTRLVTLIVGPHGDATQVLYTAFPGPLAEKEPGDPSLKTEDDRKRSAAFWSKHALSL